ncbi:hypothetical protein HPB48_015547 [Haemaphysalis longicornis]|uniref:Uncharacterized protein n=1 Tax=Haemaphysalis longicornis TaxID=44386 RepID=A0A9J6FHY4_HAELO|nr:hypothetical protein HPB48_015547 [Haemaphysalis longicornis]
MKARQVVGARKLGCAVEGAARVTARVPTSPAKGLTGLSKSRKLLLHATTPDMSELRVGPPKTTGRHHTGLTGLGGETKTLQPGEE